MASEVALVKPELSSTPDGANRGRCRGDSLMSAPSWLKSFAKSKKAKPAPSSSENPEQPQQEDVAKRAPGPLETGDYATISTDEYVQMLYGSGVTLPQKRGPTTDSERGAKQHKPLKTKMSEALEEGLSNPLAEDNVGFRMLAKMGFKAGQGLGKDAGGTTEPVDVRLKGGRKGLGVDEEKKRKQKEELSRQAADVAAMRASFVDRNKSSFRAKQIARDLNEAKKICESLDRAAGVSQSELWHQEPASPPPAAGSAEDNSRAAGALKSQLVEQTFTTAGGEVFVRTIGPDGRDEQAEGQQCMPSMDPAVDFERVVQHLRTAHRYCFYCGGRFESEEKLLWHCQHSDECAQLLQSGEREGGDDYDWDGLGD